MGSEGKPMTEIAQWAFSDPPNVAVFVDRRILGAGGWIALVSHDSEDGAWQFHTDNEELPTLSDGLLLCLQDIVTIDPSVNDLSTLPLGWIAWRATKQAPWQKSKDNRREHETADSVTGNFINQPDWYADWRQEAVQQLVEKNARLDAEFRLGEWPRYDYDFDTGKLVFSDGGVAKVIADIQVVGPTSGRAGNWLWAWANSHLPPNLMTDSMLVRAFGQQHGVLEMTHDVISDDDLNKLGWTLTSLAVRIGDALGAYRPPRNDGGGLYLLYKSLAWSN